MGRKEKAVHLLETTKDIYMITFIIWLIACRIVGYFCLSRQIQVLLSCLFVGGGLLLLAARLFVDRRHLIRKNVIWLILFLCYTLISIVVNRQYGVVDNLKAEIWMVLQMFLIGTISADRDRAENVRQMRLVANVFILLWFLAVLWSLGQFICQYESGAWVGDEWHRTGFVNNRLFGVFLDPNYAATGSLIAVILAVMQMKCFCKRKAGNAYYIVTIVCQILYIVLSGSRTALVELACVCVLTAGWLVSLRPFFVRLKKLWRFFVLLGTAAVCVAVIILGSSGIKFAASYVPGIYEAFADNSEGEGEGTETPDEDSLRSEETQAAVSAVDLTRADTGVQDISNGRFAIWQDALHLLKEVPVFGTSPGNYLAVAAEYLDEDSYIVQNQMSIHSAYLALLLYTGIPSAVFMLIWLALSWKNVLAFLIRRKNHLDQTYIQVLCCAACLLCFCVAGLFLEEMFFAKRIDNLLFWFLFGYASYLIDCEQPVGADRSRLRFPPGKKRKNT